MVKLEEDYSGFAYKGKILFSSWRCVKVYQILKQKEKFFFQDLDITEDIGKIEAWANRNNIRLDFIDELALPKERRIIDCLGENYGHLSVRCGDTRTILKKVYEVPLVAIAGLLSNVFLIKKKGGFIPYKCVKNADSGHNFCKIELREVKELIMKATDLGLKIDYNEDWNDEKINQEIFLKEL